MLDLKHPQTKHALAAARVEDDIRVRLIEMRVNGDSGVARHEILDVLLPSLQRINREHFGGSAAIAHTLEKLEAAV